MRVASMIAFAAALSLAGCSPPAATGGPAPSTGSTVSSAGDDAQACSARGGTMQRVCLMGTMACVITYPDAGKVCTDKDDCTGQCRFDGNAPPPPTATASGKCQRTSDPCGCFSTIIKGKVQPALCVD